MFYKLRARYSFDALEPENTSLRILVVWACSQEFQKKQKVDSVEYAVHEVL